MVPYLRAVQNLNFVSNSLGIVGSTRQQDQNADVRPSGGSKKVAVVLPLFAVTSAHGSFNSLF